METVSPIAVAVAGAARPTVLRFLLDQGTDTIDHPGGKLFDHLFRTAVTLAEWRVPDALVVAGLVHAVYGTDGFPVALRPIEQRAEVRGLIGDDAEQIVYTYAASDRSVTWSPAADPQRLPYRDRFTGEERTLSPGEATEYWTLTAANELDLLDRIRGAEVIIAPLEHNLTSLPPAGRDAVVAARGRYPLALV
jgi:hypothetical protein